MLSAIINFFDFQTLERIKDASRAMQHTGPFRDWSLFTSTRPTSMAVARMQSVNRMNQKSPRRKKIKVSRHNT